MNNQQLTQLKAGLGQYPEKLNPTSKYGERRSLVSLLLDDIQILRRKGYSFDDVSDAIKAEAGTFIKPVTLRKYFFEEKAKHRGGLTSIRKQQGLTPDGVSLIKTVTDNRHSTSGTGPRRSPKKTPQPASHEPASTETQSSTEPLTNPKLAVDSVVTTPAELEDWRGEDSSNDNPPAGGLLNEPTFNAIQRR